MSDADDSDTFLPLPGSPADSGNHNDSDSGSDHHPRQVLLQRSPDDDDLPLEILDEIPYPVDSATKDDDAEEEHDIDIPLPPDSSDSKYSPSQATAEDASPISASETNQKKHVAVLGRAQAKKRLQAFSAAKLAATSTTSGIGIGGKKSSPHKGVSVFSGRSSDSSKQPPLAIAAIKEEETKMKEILAMNSLLSEKLKTVHAITTSVPGPSPATAIVKPLNSEFRNSDVLLEKEKTDLLGKIKSEDHLTSFTVKKQIKNIRRKRAMSTSSNSSRSGGSRSKSPVVKRRGGGERDRDRRSRSRENERIKERDRERDRDRARDRDRDRDRNRDRGRDKDTIKRSKRSRSRSKNRDADRKRSKSPKGSKDKQRKKSRSKSRERRRRSRSRDRDRERRRSYSRSPSRGRERDKEKERERKKEVSIVRDTKKSLSPVIARVDKKATKSLSKSPSPDLLVSRKSRSRSRSKEKDKRKSKSRSKSVDRVEKRKSRSRSKDREGRSSRRRKSPKHKKDKDKERDRERDKEREKAKQVEKERREKEEKKEAERRREREKQEALERELDKVRTTRMPTDWVEYKKFKYSIDHVKDVWRLLEAKSNKARSGSRSTSRSPPRVPDEAVAPFSLGKSLKEQPALIRTTSIDLKTNLKRDYPLCYVKLTKHKPPVDYGCNLLSYAGYYKSREQIFKEEDPEIVKDLITIVDSVTPTLPLAEPPKSQEWFAEHEQVFCPTEGSKGIVISHLYSDDDMDDTPLLASKHAKLEKQKKASETTVEPLRSQAVDEEYSSESSQSQDSVPSPLLKKRYESDLLPSSSSQIALEVGEQEEERPVSPRSDEVEEMIQEVVHVPEPEPEPEPVSTKEPKVQKSKSKNKKEKKKKKKKDSKRRHSRHESKGKKKSKSEGDDDSDEKEVASDDSASASDEDSKSRSKKKKTKLDEEVVVSSKPAKSSSSVSVSEEKKKGKSVSEKTSSIKKKPSKKSRKGKYQSDSDNSKRSSSSGSSAVESSSSSDSESDEKDKRKKKKKNYKKKKDKDRSRKDKDDSSDGEPDDKGGNSGGPSSSGRGGSKSQRRDKDHDDRDRDHHKSKDPDRDRSDRKKSSKHKRRERGGHQSSSAEDESSSSSSSSTSSSSTTRESSFEGLGLDSNIELVLQEMNKEERQEEQRMIAKLLQNFEDDDFGIRRSGGDEKYDPFNDTDMDDAVQAAISRTVNNRKNDIVETCSSSTESSDTGAQDLLKTLEEDDLLQFVTKNKDLSTESLLASISLPDTVEGIVLAEKDEQVVTLVPSTPACVSETKLEVVEQSLQPVQQALEVLAKDDVEEAVSSMLEKPNPVVHETEPLIQSHHHPRPERIRCKRSYSSSRSRSRSRSLSRSRSRSISPKYRRQRPRYADVYENDRWSQSYRNDRYRSEDRRAHYANDDPHYRSREVVRGEKEGHYDRMSRYDRHRRPHSRDSPHRREYRNERDRDWSPDEYPRYPHQRRRFERFERDYPEKDRLEYEKHYREPCLEDRHTPDLIEKPITTICSALPEEGAQQSSPPLRLNVADSTISDSELPDNSVLDYSSVHEVSRAPNPSNLKEIIPDPELSHKIDSGSSGYASSPKRLSLDERLEVEMGIKLQDEPSSLQQGFANHRPNYPSHMGSKKFPAVPSHGPGQSAGRCSMLGPNWQNSPVPSHSFQGSYEPAPQPRQSQAIQLGDMLQVLPGEMPERAFTVTKENCKLNPLSVLQYATQVIRKEGDEVDPMNCVTIKVPVVPFKIPVFKHPDPEVYHESQGTQSEEELSRKQRRMEQKKIAEKKKLREKKKLLLKKRMLERKMAKKLRALEAAKSEEDSKESGGPASKNEKIEGNEMEAMDPEELKLLKEALSEVPTEPSEGSVESDKLENVTVSEASPDVIVKEVDEVAKPDDMKEADEDEEETEAKTKPSSPPQPAMEPVPAADCVDFAPPKGILVVAGFRERILSDKPSKAVKFMDGIHPGYGSSRSEGEEIHSPPPVPQNKVLIKKKEKRKKMKIKIKNEEKNKKLKILSEIDPNAPKLPPPPPPKTPYPYCPLGILYQFNPPYAVLYAQAVVEHEFEVTYTPSMEAPRDFSGQCDAVVVDEPESVQSEKQKQSIPTITTPMPIQEAGVETATSWPDSQSPSEQRRRKKHREYKSNDSDVKPSDACSESRSSRSSSHHSHKSAHAQPIPTIVGVKPKPKTASKPRDYHPTKEMELAHNDDGNHDTPAATDENIGEASSLKTVIIPVSSHHDEPKLEQLPIIGGHEMSPPFPAERKVDVILRHTGSKRVENRRVGSNKYENHRSGRKHVDNHRHKHYENHRSDRHKHGLENHRTDNYSNKHLENHRVESHLVRPEIVKSQSKLEEVSRTKAPIKIKMSPMSFPSPPTTTLPSPVKITSSSPVPAVFPAVKPQISSPVIPTRISTPPTAVISTLVVSQMDTSSPPPTHTPSPIHTTIPVLHPSTYDYYCQVNPVSNPSHPTPPFPVPVALPQPNQVHIPPVGLPSGIDLTRPPPLTPAFNPSVAPIVDVNHSNFPTPKFTTVAPTRVPGNSNLTLIRCTNDLTTSVPREIMTGQSIHLISEDPPTPPAPGTSP